MAKKNKAKDKTKAKAGGKAKGKSDEKKVKKKGKKKGKSLEPKPVGTGKGAAPGEIGADFVSMYNARTPDTEIWKKWFSPKFVSIEGEGMNSAWHGMKAVRAKNDWWTGNYTVHSTSAEGPFVGATAFGVRFRSEIEEKASGKRSVMEEVGIYSVKNGKVIQEEFMYARQP